MYRIHIHQESKSYQFHSKCLVILGQLLHFCYIFSPWWFELYFLNGREQFFELLSGGGFYINTIMPILFSWPFNICSFYHFVIYPSRIPGIGAIHFLQDVIEVVNKNHSIKEQTRWSLSDLEVSSKVIITAEWCEVSSLHP